MGLMPKEYLKFVRDMIEEDNRKTPFKDNQLGYKWYYGFIVQNRHIIDIRVEDALEFSRSKLTTEQFDEWYRDLLEQKYLIAKPCRIWNADETGFSMCTTATKVISSAKKGNTHFTCHWQFQQGKIDSHAS
jgi:hypothetical protein